MKIQRLFIYCLLAGTFLLASCSSEDMTDTPVETLSEGMYPLTFTATQDEVVATPQTRVSENTDGKSSKWSTGDQIKVTVSKTGYSVTTTCTLNESGTITDYNPKLYWQTTDNYAINAWYSNISRKNTTSNTVGLADQRSGLAYVLKANELTNKNYQSGSLPLAFKHQLAKVRVEVKKGTYSGALNVTAVSINGYTSCNVSNGSVSPSGNLNPIQMKQNGNYWEANLVPGDGALDKVITINADGKETTCTLASAVTLVAAQMYTYEVTVNQAEPTEATQNTDGSYTINAGDDVYIEGTVNNTININGTANVELRNVISSNVDTPIKITSGTPAIKIINTNTLTTKNGTAGILLDGNDANVEITGDGATSSRLTITVPDGTSQNAGSPAIGSFGEYNECGDIKISNITLTASGNKNRGSDYSAAIGTGSGFSASCGSITIENCVINATASGNAAAIGFGNVYDGGSIKSITINNSELNLTVTGEGAGIGFGGNVDNKPQSIGPITITSNESQYTFFNRFKVEEYKVGKSSKNYSNQTWQGATFNGQSLVSGNSNGYK